MTRDDMINTAVEIRTATHLIEEGSGERAAEILRNVSSWLIEQAKSRAVDELHKEWLHGDALLDSARSRVEKIHEHMAQAGLRG